MGRKLTIDQAAEELSISRRSLRRLITSGDLPAYHLGSLPQIVRIDSDDLDKLLNPLVTSQHSSPAQAPARRRRHGGPRRAGEVVRGETCKRTDHLAV